MGGGSKAGGAYIAPLVLYQKKNIFSEKWQGTPLYLNTPKIWSKFLEILGGTFKFIY